MSIPFAKQFFVLFRNAFGMRFPPHMGQKIKCAIIAHFIFIVGIIRFSECLPPFFPLVPGFIEGVVAAVLIEILRIAIVLAETLTTAGASVAGIA